jgi:hypothetical protein
MSDLENFQREHGDQWTSITQHPAFSAAMSLLNLRKIAGVAVLTDEQIEKDGKLILADLRGHLSHENDLINLSTAQEFVFGEPLRETYPDPATESEQSAEPGSSAPKKPRKKNK